MEDNKVNSGLLEFSEDQKVFVALDAETGEVQKAVTIDGDGVETDIQGVQPTGKKEITSTAEVNVASYATAQVVDEDLVAGNIKKDVDILGVVGSYEGGGASDFSTAEVTLILTPPSDTTFVTEAVSTSFLTPVVNFLYECLYLPATNHIVTVVLNTSQEEPCRINSIICLDSNETEYTALSNIETTGDITWYPDDQIFIVTGNGTIKADVAL